MNRIRYKMNIRNPLLKEIKINFPAAFEGALIASKCINNFLDLEVGEHEVAFIALHIGAALERMKSKNKKGQKSYSCMCLRCRKCKITLLPFNQSIRKQDSYCKYN